MSATSGAPGLKEKMRELGLFPPTDSETGEIQYSPEASGLAAILTHGLNAMGCGNYPPIDGKREDLLSTLVQSMLGDLTESDVKRVLTNVLGCEVYEDPSDGKSYIGPNAIEFCDDFDEHAKPTIETDSSNNSNNNNDDDGGLNTAFSNQFKQENHKKNENDRKSRLQTNFAQHVKSMPLEQQSECDRMVSVFRAANVKPLEIMSCMCVRREAILERAKSQTTCASCLHSVRTLRLMDHPLLEDDGEYFRIRKMHLDSIEKTARVCSVYSSTSNWTTTKLHSNKKKGSRCRAHASFRKQVDLSDWRMVWDNAPDEFKIGVSSMLASELAQVRTMLCCFSNVKDTF